MDQGSVVAVFDRLCFGCSMGMYMFDIFFRFCCFMHVKKLLADAYEKFPRGEGL